MAQGQVAMLQQQNSFSADLDKYTPNIKDALPAHMPVERFKRVVVTAVSQNPDLLYANRRTLFTACQRCAVDGLYPDGREAALVVYNTRVKQRDPETGLDREVRMDVVQYMPMISGIRKRLRNSGEVDSAIAEAVHERDQFRYGLGDQAYIEHEPPPLGEDRGQVIGAYAIIRLKNGEVIRDVMDRVTIEQARNQGRAPNSLMWKHFYHEGAKKTVLRRAAKQAPLSPELERLMGRDEEPTTIQRDDPLPILEHREPEPERPIAAGTEQHHEAGPQYAVVDMDGVEHVYQAGPRACEALQLLLQDAQRVGVAQLDGVWESNEHLLELLNATGFAQEAIDLAMLYANARQQPAAEETQPPPTDGGQPAATAASAPAASLAPLSSERQSMVIPPVMKQGKLDGRTWTVALFMPKLRRQRDSATLAFLLGDNEKTLEDAKRMLGKDELTELEEAIRHQWKLVENG
jgi:phage RecT family recombinase